MTSVATSVQGHRRHDGLVAAHAAPVLVYNSAPSRK